MKHPFYQFVYCPKCGSKEFVEQNDKAKHCRACGFTYYFNPSASTVAFILNERNELLVCRRAKEPAKGTLDLPGGFLDTYETGEEGVIREVKEETGMEVLQTEFLFSIPHRYLYSDFVVHTLDLFYRCRVKQCENLEAHDDVAEAFFIPLERVNPEDFGLDSIRKGVIRFLTI